jgi:hypothetical protein
LLGLALAWTLYELFRPVARLRRRSPAVTRVQAPKPRVYPSL